MHGEMMQLGFLCRLPMIPRTAISGSKLSIWVGRRDWVDGWLDVASL
jgi:hypothetical protein